MNVKKGTKVRWLGDSELGLVTGKIYTANPIDEETTHLVETGINVSYPISQFEIVEVKAGTQIRWIGRTEWLILTNKKIYTVLSVEKEWFRVIDDSGEDYLYPPELFEIVE